MSKNKDTNINSDQVNNQQDVNKNTSNSADQIGSQNNENEDVSKGGLKPYIHIDTFLSTAIPMYNLDRMKVRGFKMFMKGNQYQKDEKVFEDNLKKYLNIE